MAGERKLTEQQEIFCDEIARGRSPTEAATKAGYKNPKAAVSKLKKSGKLQIAIEERRKTFMDDEAEVADKEEILEFLTQTMRGNEEVRIRMKAAELLGKRTKLFQEEEPEWERVVIVDDIK